MTHVDLPTLDAFAASRPLRRRDALHIDRCVECRRAAAERGASDDLIASAVAATRSRTGAIAAACVLAAAVGAAAVAVPLRGAASGFFAVFEPHRVAAVPLTLDDMRSLSRMPDLWAYASTRELHASTWATFSDTRAATSAAGFALRQPTYVPTGIRGASYTVNGPSAELLNFGARAPAAGAAARVPLPPDIAASTLRIDLGPTVVAAYQTGASAADEGRLRRAMQRLAAESSHSPVIIQRRAMVRNSSTGQQSGWFFVNGGRVTPSIHVAGARHVRVFGASSVRPGMPPGFAAGAGLMPLVLVQMPVPRIASTGVSAQRIVSFMLSQPGIPPRVAAAFGALGDLSTTLPIPVPIDKAYTQPVLVDGVPGVGLGDDTGIGAAVVWQKNGMLYAVFATQTAHDVLAIANSLR